MKFSKLEIQNIINPNNFDKFSVDEKKHALQQLCNYVLSSAYIHRIKIKFIDLGDISGGSFFDEITINSKLPMDTLDNYLFLIDSVVHECFHVIQFYICKLEKQHVSDTLWNTITNYLLYNCISNTDSNVYRFSQFERDAYRFADTFMTILKKHQDKQGIDTKVLYKYIYKERRTYNRHINYAKACYGDEYLSIIDKKIIEIGLENAIENECSEESTEDYLLSMKKGDVGSLTDSSQYPPDISVDFIEHGEEIFKKMNPYIFHQSKTLEL